MDPRRWCRGDCIGITKTGLVAGSRKGSGRSCYCSVTGLPAAPPHLTSRRNSRRIKRLCILPSLPGSHSSGVRREFFAAEWSPSL